MRYLPAVGALAVIVGFAACSSATKVTLPAVAPEDVEVFMPNTYPEEKYEVLKTITIEEIVSADEREMIKEARAKAAALGADALLVQSLRMTSSGGGLEAVDPTRDRKILQALAVYYPSKHPEAGNQ